MNHTEHFTLGTGHGYRGLLQVGLFNAMPDAALRATEIQFARLLKDAAGALDVRLRLFSPASLPREEETRARMEGFYEDAGLLPAAGLDALIVAAPDGDAPDAAWRDDLAALLDWAQAASLAAIFSGGAVPAALACLDGIASRPLAHPLFGVYSGQRVADDSLFFHTAWDAGVPHIRDHTFAGADLEARGYRVLSRLADDSVDIFARETAGHFLFLQGHPEHDDGALGRAYLRAVARFRNGEIAARPPVPRNYFDRLTESRLAALPEGTGLSGHAAIVQAARPLQSWRGQAVRLFANWLTRTAAAKMRRAASRAVHVRRRRVP
ncbi:MAG: hypothetical protein BGN82_05320 [Alphaproteobacteria bacterium 65-7]|nr:MAG: hypothetical protein BGN82_05320 [Alphaproteobacteria bacterium 65-7]